MYEVKVQQGLEYIPDAALIREAVFVREQGFCNEFDETDKTAWHVVVYEGNRPMATGRTFSEDGKSYHLGRIAVLKEFRGLHLGALVVQSLEKEAKRLGAVRFELSAQVRAKGFYEKLGYTAMGEEYPDEHVPHVMMQKYA
ncbi:GNAT family N-acetyltransferase [Hydrogenoanaerobacterium sp.]|uniref:GNAT family N-acetyltransferase n=1 Tax=Hydrogenoanaerobacterium sp. TaxID=2953763 RepID=UPI0028A02468|nr:GNAT family N-acetyltransferase [Hydrogenoanaerobacterium sp.]